MPDHKYRGFHLDLAREGKRERNRQFGRDFTSGAVGYVVGCLFFVIVATAVIDAFIPSVGNWLSPRDDTDSMTRRSGVSLVVDHGTGCEYLRTRFGGITPRLGVDGKQVCG